MGVLVKNGKSYTGTGDLLIQPVIYSDDERCIGVWRDGKPLYQKTISFDDTMFQTDGYGKKITVTIPDVEAIKTSQVFIENNTLPLAYVQGSIYATYWAIVDDTDMVDIVFRYSSEIGSNLHGFFINSTAILQYTKTTDTAGTAAWVPTGATPIHYSLNEQVIGTWIDGKPLYQKTYSFENPQTGGVTYDLNIQNLGHIVNQFGIWERTGDGHLRTYNINAVNESSFETQYIVLVRATVDTGRFYVYIPSSGEYSSAVSKVIVTIQYTKTID